MSEVVLVSPYQPVGSSFVSDAWSASSADWVALKDLPKLHSISPAASFSLTTRFDEQILNSLDEQNWAIMSDEWDNFMLRSGCKDSKKHFRCWFEKEEVKDDH